MIEAPTVDLYELHENQTRLIHESARFNVVNCGRRFGKTILGIDLACDVALGDAERGVPGYPVGWFAPEYRLLREAWRELLTILDAAIKRVSEQEKRVELITGGVIECWAFDRNPNAGRSRKYKRVVIDEAAHCDYLETVWTKAVRPTLTDYQGDAWFLSSPNGENYFHQLWQRGQSGEAGWKSWTFTSYDNPFLQPSEIDAAKVELPGWVFDQEYLAKFHADGGDQLLPLEWVERCYTAPREDVQPGERWLSIDISKGTGRDRTVCFIGDDLGVIHADISNTTDLQSSAQMVAALSRRFGVDHERIVYDGGGWAGPDFGRYLAALGIHEATAHFGGATGGNRYRNRRTRGAWLLRQRLDPTRERLIAPVRKPLPDDAYPEIARRKAAPEPVKARTQPAFSIPAHVIGGHWPDLRRELLALRYTYGGAKLELESKDDLVERLGRSPDLADTLIMAASLWAGDV